MRHQRFDFKGNSLKQNVDHLYSSAGFLDDTWWHRTYLQIGREMKAGYGGWTIAGRTHISGRALVKNEERAFGFGRMDYSHTGSHLGLQASYRLFAAEVQPRLPAEGGGKKKGRKSARRVKYIWSQSVPFYPRAMLLAGSTLFVAGPADTADFFAKDPKGRIHLWAVAAQDGTRLAEYDLKAAPVYDSLAACDGRLFCATLDSRIVCWK
jgi:hypothetical protein